MTNIDLLLAPKARQFPFTDDHLKILANPDYPRSAAYDPHWLVDCTMGPHVLWLMEWALKDFHLEPGMRVLDLGCGQAVSSIFLAREYGVRVWAADLWIPPTPNWYRIQEFGLQDRIMPIHAEAHDLKFADGYFDAIVSFDAYQYLGTDDLYMGYLSKFLRPGGQMCVVMPGLKAELTDGPPDNLAELWASDFACFHSADWWRKHLERTGHVQIDIADEVSDAIERWLEWSQVCADVSAGLHDGKAAADTVEMLRRDGGETFAFTRLIATRQRG